MKLHKLIVGFALLLILSACGSKPVATEQLPAATEPPTPVPTATVPPSPTPIPPTPTPEFQQYYTEEFEKDLKYWPSFIVNGKTGVIAKDPVDKVALTAEGGFFKFDIMGTGFFVYSTYDPFDYEDVRLDTSMVNQGENENFLALVCRYSEENGWYEFNIGNDGLYAIYYAKAREDGYVNYAPIGDGGSNKIKTGHETNELSLVCKGNTLSVYVNGNLTKEVKDDKLTSGKVGISISSFRRVPVTVSVDWIKISQP